MWIFLFIRRINVGVDKNDDVNKPNNVLFCKQTGVDSDSQVSYILINLILP